MATLIAVKMRGQGREKNLNVEVEARQQRKQLCLEEGVVHKVPTHVVGHGACENQGADDLTNEEFGKFDVNKRIHLRGEDIKWKVLKELMEGSLQLYEEVRKMKEDQKAAPKKLPFRKRGRKSRKILEK